MRRYPAPRACRIIHCSRRRSGSHPPHDPSPGRENGWSIVEAVARVVGLAAGAARVEITPEPGVELMGYGARVGRSTGVHDPLYARGLWLAPASGAPILIISADLCLISAAAAAGIRERLAAQTGLLPKQILVGCTHTHSGPDTGLAAETSGAEPPAHVPALMAGLERAGRQAREAARPARIGWARGEARIGRNRRLENGTYTHTHTHTHSLRKSCTCR